MATIQNTDTPEQARERARLNVMVAQRLYHAAQAAERLAKRFREGAEHLRNEQAADGGPLVPSPEHISASAKMLDYLTRLERFIDCDGVYDLP